MRNAISFEAIRHIRLGPSHSAVIVGEDVYGVETEVFLKTADIPGVAAPLLCCAAAASSRSPPPAATIIPGCHLPVTKWKTGRSTINGQPLLILEVAGASTLVFQFALQSAQQCGQALMGTGAAPAPGTQASQSPPAKSTGSENQTVNTDGES
jgi:hypothetical protein